MNAVVEGNVTVSKDAQLARSSWGAVHPYLTTFYLWVFEGSEVA